MGRIRLLPPATPATCGDYAYTCSPPCTALPVGFALTGAKADERTVLLDILPTDPTLSTPRPDQIIIADKNYFGTEFETTLADAGLTLLRPARKGEPPRAGTRFFTPLRQTIESIFDTDKGQLNLEHHGGKTPTASWSASSNASSPSPPRSGTTTTPANPSNGHYWPTTTDRPLGIDHLGTSWKVNR